MDFKEVSKFLKQITKYSDIYELEYDVRIPKNPYDPKLEKIEVDDDLYAIIPFKLFDVGFGKVEKGNVSDDTIEEIKKISKILREYEI